MYAPLSSGSCMPARASLRSGSVFPLVHRCSGYVRQGRLNLALVRKQTTPKRPRSPYSTHTLSSHLHHRALCLPDPSFLHTLYPLHSLPRSTHSLLPLSVFSTPTALTGKCSSTRHCITATNGPLVHLPHKSVSCRAIPVPQHRFPKTSAWLHILLSACTLRVGGPSLRAVHPRSAIIASSGCPRHRTCCGFAEPLSC
jgi:hypothetical protein